MTALAELYAAQPFWIWLAVGVLLLAVEAMFSTEWLLWPAVSAGVVAVLTAVGFQPGLPAEVAIFALLTVANTGLLAADPRVRLAEVEGAQKEILAIVRKMAEDGTLQLAVKAEVFV